MKEQYKDPLLRRELEELKEGYIIFAKKLCFVLILVILFATIIAIYPEGSKFSKKYMIFNSIICGIGVGIILYYNLIKEYMRDKKELIKKYNQYGNE
jgi:hypothetical protein